MPFGGEFDNIWRRVYRPSIEAASLEALRADDVFCSRDIMQNVWRATQDAKVVLADLSGRNANVFYEIGLAHAIGQPVVLVAGSMADVPFDLQSLRVVTYNPDGRGWATKLKKEVTASLMEAIAEPTRAIPSTFLDARDIPNKVRVSAHELEMIQIRQEFDSLRREFSSLVRAQEALSARLQSVPDVRSSVVPPSQIAPRMAVVRSPMPVAAPVFLGDGPNCSDCGELMVRKGACYKCLNCGSTSGVS